MEDKFLIAHSTYRATHSVHIAAHTQRKCRQHYIEVVCFSFLMTNPVPRSFIGKTIERETRAPKFVGPSILKGVGHNNEKTRALPFYQQQHLSIALVV